MKIFIKKLGDGQLPVLLKQESYLKFKKIIVQPLRA